MAIPLLAAVLLLSIGASVSIVSRKFHQVNATTWVKYYFQMIENMSLGLSVGIVQSGYRSPKIAANEQGFVQLLNWQHKAKLKNQS